MNYWRLTLAFSVLFLAGCASKAPPSSQSNACDIFAEQPKWYDAVQDASGKWGISGGTILAFMRQESSFVHDARPPRTKILWVIPGPRASNAFGYAQAKTETWREYRRDANRGADRDNFRDAADFIGWYNARSARQAGISRRNAKHLYLAYHEGVTGYKRKNYLKKPWLNGVADKVARTAQAYDAQIASCGDRFKRSWWPF